MKDLGNFHSPGNIKLSSLMELNLPRVMVLTFKSLDEIWKCKILNPKVWPAIQMFIVLNKVVQTSEVCGKNPKAIAK